MIHQPDHAAGKWLRTRWILVIRLLLAAVFLYAGAVKLLQTPQAFADSIASFRMLPRWAISLLALALPPFEMLVGCALLAGFPRRLGAFCALLLSMIFLVALVVAMASGIPVDCGCFGNGPAWLPITGSQKAWFDLVRDGLMAIVTGFLYRGEVAVTAPEAVP